MNYRDNQQREFALFLPMEWMSRKPTSSNRHGSIVSRLARAIGELFRASIPGRKAGLLSSVRKWTAAPLPSRPRPTPRPRNSFRSSRTCSRFSSLRGETHICFGKRTRTFTSDSDRCMGLFILKYNYRKIAYNNVILIKKDY